MLAARGRAHFFTGQMTAAYRELRQAAGLTAAADLRLAAELLSDAYEVGYDAGLPGAQAACAELIADLARQPEADEAVRFLADETCSDDAWSRGDPERGRFLIHRAISRLDAVPQLSGNPGHQIAICYTWSRAGELGKARQCAERAIELAQSTGALGHLPRALDMLTNVDWQMGRWTQALAHASQILDLAREAGQPRLVAEPLVVMAYIEAAQGRDAASREHAREADRLAGELSIRRLQYLARRSQALLKFGQGRAEEAIARYEETTSWRSTGVPSRYRVTQSSRT
jgi:tetratricopeptide (TPR) repeat protein